MMGRGPAHGAICAALGLYAIAASLECCSANGGSRILGDGCHVPSPYFSWSFSAGAEYSSPPASYDHSVLDVGDALARGLAAGKAQGGLRVVIQHGFSTAEVAAGDGAAVGVLSGAHESLPFVYASEGGLTATLAEASEAAGFGTPRALQDHHEALAAATGQDSGILSLRISRGSTLGDLSSLVSELSPILRGKSAAQLLVVGEVDGDRNGCGRRNLLAEGLYRRAQLVSDNARSVKITPDILAGLLFLLLFVFALYVGLGCINDVGSDPQLFITEDLKPALGREY